MRLKDGPTIQTAAWVAGNPNPIRWVMMWLQCEECGLIMKRDRFHLTDRDPDVICRGCHAALSRIAVRRWEAA